MDGQGFLENLNRLFSSARFKKCEGKVVMVDEAIWFEFDGLFKGCNRLLEISELMIIIAPVVIDPTEIFMVEQGPFQRRLRLLKKTFFCKEDTHFRVNQVIVKPCPCRQFQILQPDRCLSREDKILAPAEMDIGTYFTIHIIS